MIVTPTLQIPDSDLEWSFIRSSGPGGQNVNKVATAVQLRFYPERCPLLSDEVRQRLNQIAGRRMTTDGAIVIDARRFRSQLQNREDAAQRLAAMIRQALHRPRIRHKTRPTAASRRRRIEAKQHRSQIKDQRRRPASEE
jgi:ribosome-associated protein